MEHYHLRTAYNPVGMGGHRLDFSQRPASFKEYRRRETLNLPGPVVPDHRFWPLALGWPPSGPPAPERPTAAMFSAVCLMTAGITSRRAHLEFGGFRAPASAGALYPCELYCAARDVAGLEDGLYHFDPQQPGLRLLWPGALAAKSAAASGGPPARLSFWITVMFWRSLWKYRTRAYRYCLLDTGHMLANLELATAAFGLAPRQNPNFADRAAAHFLGMALDDEAPLAALAAGGAPADPGPDEPGLPPFDLDHAPLSPLVGRDPEILAAHQEGELAEPAPPPIHALPALPPYPLKLGRPAPPENGPTILEVVRGRRSLRRYGPIGLTKAQVSLLMAAALPQAGPCSAQVILSPTGELTAGAYRYLPVHHALAPVATDRDARPTVARACLEQEWAGKAGLLLVLWANLEQLGQRLGPRGYRLAMIEAGRVGQRLYLAAQALGMGCCGIGAFYDDQLAQAARLPEGAAPLYALAVGKPGN